MRESEQVSLDLSMIYDRQVAFELGLTLLSTKNPNDEFHLACHSHFF